MAHPMVSINISVYGVTSVYLEWWAFELFSSFLHGYLCSFFFVKSLKWSLFILKWLNKPKTYTSSFSCLLGYLVSVCFDVKYFHVKQFTYFSLFLFGCIKGEYSNIFQVKCKMYSNLWAQIFFLLTYLKLFSNFRNGEMIPSIGQIKDTKSREEKDSIKPVVLDNNNIKKGFFFYSSVSRAPQLILEF